MTLLETIRTIERVAAAQPAVNMIVENDVFKLNACPDALYGVFAFVQGQHSGDISSDFISYNFTLFYVDRLTSAKDNQIEVQSTGVQVLDNIIRILQDEGIMANPYSFQPFNQRFNDECAGVFCNVTFEVLNAPCGETFTDNNNIKII